MARKVLLVCGVLAAVLYGVMITAIRYEGYHPLSQTVSELSAVGVPTRSLFMVLGAVYEGLLVAFGVGLWRSAGGRRALRLAGALVVGLGLLGLVWPFASMSQRDVLAAGGGGAADTLHLVLVALTVLAVLVSIGAASTAFGRPFLLYSLATLLVLLVSGTVTSVAAPRVQANLPTPLLGLWERINIGVFLLWMAVLAVRLLRPPRRPGLVPRKAAA